MECVVWDTWYPSGPAGPGREAQSDRRDHEGLAVRELFVAVTARFRMRNAFVIMAVGSHPEATSQSCVI